MQLRLLVVDEDTSIGTSLASELSPRGIEVVMERAPDAALRRLLREDFQAMMCDALRVEADLELCRQAVALREELPVIVTASMPTVEAAISAMRAGACDFLTKPMKVTEWLPAIDRAFEQHALRERVRRLRRVDEQGSRFDDIVGGSKAMQRIFDMIMRVADSDATVLVTGESGTGKELVARALHDRSSRAAAPFVAINCAAMPESLLESELFGHVKGAFTDARGGREGLFTQASKGTLFLDEIAEMPVGMQAKLLRALQERTVRPVGSNEEVPFDTRIVAATNRDLEVEIAERRFREDLFYRINVVHIDVPPLRARGDDVLTLAQHFLLRCQGGTAEAARVQGLKRAAAERLLAYPWPGNVRELQNSMERAVALAQFDQVGLEDLPERVTAYRATGLPSELASDPRHFLPMDEIEQRYIRKVLDAMGGNKASAARVLGVDRRTLYRKLDRWRVFSETSGKEKDSVAAAE